MKSRVLFAAALTAVLALCGAALAGPTEDVQAATCMVRNPAGECGTGFVVQSRDDGSWVLTNAHIVGRSTVVTCTFPSCCCQGQVFAVVAQHSFDAALLRVNCKVKPLALATTMPKAGDVINSYGYAEARPPTWLVGTCSGYDYDGDLMFDPPPKLGRSGSPILNDRCQVVAILKARTNPPRYGYATSVAALRSIMAYAEKDRGRQLCSYPGNVAYPIAIENLPMVSAQCGPGVGCGPNGCAPSTGIFNRQPSPSPVYPTLPRFGNDAPTPAVPVTPPFDDSRILQALADLGTKVQQVQPLAPIAVTPPAPAPPDPRIDQALGLAGQADKKADAIGQAVVQLGAKVDETGKAVGEIQGAVKPLLKLHDKLEADAEAGGPKGKIAQKILDTAEGTGGGDDSLRKVLITTGIVLGLVLLVGIAVIHTMRTGKGPANDIIEKLVARHPDNERLQAIHAKIDALDAKLYRGGERASLAADLLPHAVGAGVGAATGNVPAVAANAAGAGADVFRQVKDYIEARLAPAPGQQPTGAAPPVNVNVTSPGTAA